MASHFEEESFFLVEKSNRMVTVTPFMGKLTVHIRQFYVNDKGENKPGKNGITLELEEFCELVLSSAEPRVFAGSNQAPEERGSSSNHTLYQ